jgi:hypothetical protein
MHDCEERWQQSLTSSIYQLYQLRQPRELGTSESAEKSVSCSSFAPYASS